MDTNRTEEIIAFYKEEIKRKVQLRDLLTRYPNLPYDSVTRYYNLASDLLLHFILLGIDISISCKHLLISRETKNHEETNYFARLLALHSMDLIVERGGVSSRLNIISKDIIVGLNLDLLRKPMKSLQKAINEYKNSNKKRLRLIRDSVIAHRLGDGIAQNESINEVDIDNIGATTIRLLEIIDDACKFLIKVMGELDMILTKEARSKTE